MTGTRRPDADTVREAARGRWREIVRSLASTDLPEDPKKHGPCPSCGGKDRFRFDDKHGAGTFYCNQGHDGKQAGDGFDLLRAINGWSFTEALKEVARHLGVTADSATATTARREPTPPSAATPQPMLPVPADAPAPPTKHPKFGEASASWTYRDATGNTLFHVCRFDTPSGKEIRPLAWWPPAHPPDRAPCGWRWKGVTGSNRPLYGLDRLAKEPQAPVLVVEGEKAADAAQRLLPNVVCITWLGGSSSVRSADWSPLKGRRVAVWPDADPAGDKAATKIRKLVEPLAGSTLVIPPPGGVPRGWDLADAEGLGWTTAQVSEHIRAASAPKEEEPEESAAVNGLITPLGYDGEHFYYLPHRAGQVRKLRASEHRELQLRSLAPIHYWERTFEGTEGPNWKAAAEALMRTCEAAGVYDPRRLRGRGCWWEEGTAIVHLGEKLMVDNKELQISDWAGRYIYQRAAALQGPADEPLNDDEAGDVIRTASMVNWERQASAELLLGWIVLAPICGALHWRPHIWLTGGSGSGKSTLLSDFVTPLLGGFALPVQGETTEAGIRQQLGSDALPVVFDEAEQNDLRDAKRVQAVLALMRQASSESGAVVLKGSAGGEATTFQVRSMFALASIGAGIRRLADTTRISVLGIRSADAASTARWPELAERFAAVNQATGRRLVARTISLLPVIRDNVEVFRMAAAEEFGMQRIGDQYGHLLAGAYSLRPQGRKRATKQQAADFIRWHDWTEYVEPSQERDEERCLAMIYQHMLRVDGHSSSTTLAVGDLIETKGFRTGVVSINVSPEIADAVLRRMGIKVDAGFLFISNTAQGVREALRDSPWSDNWSTVLRRLEGAEAAGVTRFGPAVGVTRAVKIPLKQAE